MTTTADLQSKLLYRFHSILEEDGVGASVVLDALQDVAQDFEWIEVLEEMNRARNQLKSGDSFGDEPTKPGGS